MCATVSVVSVQSPTCAPRRAAANAASQPACPAPITITSKLFFMSQRSSAELACDLTTNSKNTKTHEETGLYKTFLLRASSCSSCLRGQVASHLPIQKREKICSSRSSGARRPLIFFERGARIRQIREHEFLRHRSAFRARGCPRAEQRAMRAIDQRDVPDVGHRGTIAQRIDVERRRDPAAQFVETRARRRRHAHGAIVVPHRDQIDLICNVKNFAIKNFAPRSRTRSILDEQHQVGDGHRLPARARRLRLPPDRRCRAVRPCRRA